MNFFGSKIKFSSFIYFKIVFLTLGIFYVLVSQSTRKTPQIEWTKSNYASGYQIQIKNSKGIRIIDKKIVDNKYPIKDLEPGNYQMRVGVLSPFSQPVVWSRWSSLTVKSKLIKEERSADEKGIKTETTTETVTENENLLGSLKDVPESSPCLTTKIPREVIKECKKDYIVLDLTTKEKKSIYNIYTLGGTNRSARLQVIRYYRNECKSADSSVTKKLKSQLDSKDPRINKMEKEEIQKTLDILENCN